MSMQANQNYSMRMQTTVSTCSCASFSAFAASY